MIELTSRHRQESEMETERLCSAQQQAERLMEMRERVHRQQIKALEQQVCQHHMSVCVYVHSCSGIVQCRLGGLRAKHIMLSHANNNSNNNKLRCSHYITLHYIEIFNVA